MKITRIEIEKMVAEELLKEGFFDDIKSKKKPEKKKKADPKKTASKKKQPTKQEPGYIASSWNWIKSLFSEAPDAAVKRQTMEFLKKIDKALKEKDKLTALQKIVSHLNTLSRKIFGSVEKVDAIGAPAGDIEAAGLTEAEVSGDEKKKLFDRIVAAALLQIKKSKHSEKDWIHGKFKKFATRASRWQRQLRPDKPKSLKDVPRDVWKKKPEKKTFKAKARGWKKCTKILRRGCTGDSVEFMQKALSQLDPKYKNLLGRYGTDGKFGRNTKKAVKAFQRDAGFKGRNVDGVYGPMTHKAWKKAFEKKKLAAKPPEVSPQVIKKYADKIASGDLAPTEQDKKNLEKIKQIEKTKPDLYKKMKKEVDAIKAYIPGGTLVSPALYNQRPKNQ